MTISQFIGKENMNRFVPIKGYSRYGMDPQTKEVCNLRMSCLMKPFKGGGNHTYVRLTVRKGVQLPILLDDLARQVLNDVHQINQPPSSPKEKNSSSAVILEALQEVTNLASASKESTPDLKYSWFPMAAEFIHLKLRE